MTSLPSIELTGLVVRKIGNFCHGNTSPVKKCYILFASGFFSGPSKKRTGPSTHQCASRHVPGHIKVCLLHVSAGTNRPIGQQTPYVGARAKNVTFYSNPGFEEVTGNGRLHHRKCIKTHPTNPATRMKVRMNHPAYLSTRIVTFKSKNVTF